MGVFHLTFSVGDHWSGRSGATTTPSPRGPRNWGQPSSAHNGAVHSTSAIPQSVLDLIPGFTAPCRGSLSLVPQRQQHQIDDEQEDDRDFEDEHPAVVLFDAK